MLRFLVCITNYIKSSSDDNSLIQNTPVTYEDLRNNQEMWEKLQEMVTEQDPNNPDQKVTNSLLKKHLTPEVFEVLVQKQTAKGSILADCISSGVENPKSNIGIYAADTECYEKFKLLFHPIIRTYHDLPSYAKLDVIV